MRETERQRRRTVKELSKKPYEESIRDNARQINEATFKEKEWLWFTSLGANMEDIRNGKDVSALPRHLEETALVISAGPSIFSRLETVKEAIRTFRFRGPIIAVDKILKPCLNCGIDPDIVVSCDGDPEIAEFFKNPLYLHGKTKAVMNCMTIHPDTVWACPYPIYWYLGIIDDPTEPKSLTRMIHYMTGRTMLQGLGNVGGMAWNLALYLGCTRIGMLGMDYGYPVETTLEDTIYYKAYRLLVGEKAIKQCFRTVTNPRGNEVLTDLNWDVYKEIFLAYSKAAKADTVNLSPTSALFGPGIRFQDLETFLHGNK